MAYINETRQAFLFDNREEAEVFVKETPGVYCSDKSAQKTKSICSYCYASGADAIIMYKGGTKETRLLRERHLDKHYYNCRLSADITRLVHTQNKKYLEDLAECNFIVPIRIINSIDVSISYATVLINKNSKDHMYLAFTDLYEYDKWTAKIPNKNSWKPLQVDAAGLKRIGKDHGVVINVYGGRNVIWEKDFKKIRIKEEDIEEEE